MRSGWPSTVAVFLCWIPAAGAARVAVQVISSGPPGAPSLAARLVAGHVMSAAAIVSSVTVTGSSRMDPVFATKKVTFIVESFGTPKSLRN